MTKSEYTIFGLFDQKGSQYSDQVTGNPVFLPGLRDQETQREYPVYMQPYETENEYGILDSDSGKISLLEVTSGLLDDSEPSITCWWKTDISPYQFLDGVNQFYSEMKTDETVLQKGRLLVSGPVNTINIGCVGELEVVHTRHFDLTAPFTVSDAESMLSAYYELQPPDIAAEYGWPFSFDSVTNLIMCSQYGEIRYDVLSGVAGVQAEKSIYGSYPEQYITAVEQYCSATQSKFPPRMLSTVFSYAMADDYQ